MKTAILIDEKQALALPGMIRAACDARRVPLYWLPNAVRLVEGPHAGRFAIDYGEEALNMEMRPGVTLRNLPDFAGIMKWMGNPKPVDLDPAWLPKPDTSALTGGSRRAVKSPEV